MLRLRLLLRFSQITINPTDSNAEERAWGVTRGQRRTGGHFENFIQMLGKLAIAKTAFCWRYMTAISITGSLHFGHIQKLV